VTAVGAVEEAGGLKPYMFRDARLKLLLAESLPYAKLIEDSKAHHSAPTPLFVT
jgi:hypothetical protein